MKRDAMEARLGVLSAALREICLVPHPVQAEIVRERLLVRGIALVGETDDAAALVGADEAQGLLAALRDDEH